MDLKRTYFKMNHLAQRRPPALRGQSLVEFALLLPLLLLIVLGVADLGRAFQALIAVTNASREGARQGVFNPSDQPAMVNAAVMEAATLGITINPANVTVTCSPCTRGNPLRVTVRYQFNLVMNFLFTTPIWIERYTEMRVP